MASFLKKIVIIFVIFSVLSPNFILFSTIKRAEAIPPGWAGLTLFDVTAFMGKLWDKMEKYMDLILQALRDAVVKRLLDMITADVIDYVTNGGKPKFVQDWKGYLRKAGDVTFDTINNYLQKEGLNLCAPFAPQLQIQLVGMRKYYDLKYSQMPVMCSFDNFKRNIENTKGIIERGDWVSYDAGFSPEVNPYWLSLTMEDEFVRKMTEEGAAKQSEAQSSSGFLGQKVCTEYINSEEEVKAACEGLTGTDYDGCMAAFDEDANCKSYETQTPGDVVAKSITGDLGIAKDAVYLSNVQSVISAIINVAINRIISSGLSNLIGKDKDGNVVEGGDPYGYDGDLSAVCNSSIINLSDAKKDYADMIIHIDKYISPVLDADISLIATKPCASNTASSTTFISITDENGIVSTTTIGELNEYLIELKGDTVQAKIDAVNGMSEVEEVLDTIDSGGCTQDLINDVNEAMGNYQKFASNYQDIFSDMKSRTGTKKPGPLEVDLKNIKKALQNFSCPAAPVSRRKSFIVFV